MCICPFQICGYVTIFFTRGLPRKSHLPHPVFFPNKLRSKEERTMQQSEHVPDEQNRVLPLSPRLHCRCVPCQRLFSLPTDRPAATNCPRASTAALCSDIDDCFIKAQHKVSVPIGVVISQRCGSRENLVHSPDSWARTPCMPPRCFELICD
jgi:hypothetical protein